MTRLAAPLVLVVVVVVPAVGRADAAPLNPLSRSVRVPVVISLTTDRDYPDHEFVLDPSPRGTTRYERFRLLPAAGPRQFGPVVYGPCTLYAVPKRLLEGSPGPEAVDRKWFAGDLPHGIELVGSLDLRGYYLPFWDDRKVVERTVRVDRGPDGWRLVTVADNDPDPPPVWGWVAGVCFLPVGLIGLGVWMARRLRRRARPSPPAA